MKIENTEVAFYERSRKAAGLPHGNYEAPKAVDRLARAKIGSGHDCWLKGVLVTATVTASQAWWLQFGRYHFADIVSSTSKMHSILEMTPTFHPATDKAVIENFKDMVYEADAMLDREPTLLNATIEALAMDAPMGLQLTAEITTNFLQLKTIHAQRRTHKLSEWQMFCDWIESLEGMPV